MKTINRNSWHYRLNALNDNFDERRIQSVCQYWVKTIWMMILITFMIAFVLMLLYLTLNNIVFVSLMLISCIIVIVLTVLFGVGSLALIEFFNKKLNKSCNQVEFKD